MADKRISQLDSASALNGLEEVAIVQSGTTKKTPVSAFRNYITVAANAGQMSSATITFASGNTSVQLSDAAYSGAEVIFVSDDGTQSTNNIYLPSASSSEDKNIIIITDDTYPRSLGSRNVGIYPQVGEQIDGKDVNSALNLTYAYSYVELYSDGTQWYTLRQDLGGHPRVAYRQISTGATSIDLSHSDYEGVEHIQFKWTGGNDPTNVTVTLPNNDFQVVSKGSDDFYRRHKRLTISVVGVPVNGNVKFKVVAEANSTIDGLVPTDASTYHTLKLPYECISLDGIEGENWIVTNKVEKPSNRHN